MNISLNTVVLNSRDRYGTAQFKVYMCVQAHTCACTFNEMHVKLQKLACTRTVACNFGVHMRASEHTRHTRNARHELALGLPHYTFGVTTGTVAVGNEMQLIGFFICCNEYRSKVLMKGRVHTEYARISSYHEWTRLSIVQRKNYLQL